MRAAVALVLVLGVTVLAVYGIGLDSIRESVGGLTVASLALAFLALLGNAVAASFRFQIIARDTGTTIGFRQAMAAVGGGSLGGAIFFQVAGQLLARGAIMARGGVPVASVVMMTAYERAIAAAVSMALAAAGGYFLFGRIAVDMAAGGAELVKIAAGLLAAVVTGACLGYARPLARGVAGVSGRGVGLAVLRSTALSLVVQAPMMVAYVVIVRTLAPEIPVTDLVAATAIVMFAASLPVSSGGWGIRELSAIAALGAIGVAPSDALLAAVVIGIGSLLSMAAVTALSLNSWTGSSETPHRASPSLDHDKILAWVVPIMVAVLVPFQVHLPVGSGTTSVNLADPFAVLAVCLLAVGALRAREWPRWALPRTNLALAMMTGVLALGLLIGAAEIGWTTWAVLNRFAGWFVLLGFLAAGAAIVRAAGEEGLRTLLLTFGGAMVAVAAIEIVLAIVTNGVVALPQTILSHPIDGFAQNRNAFAFQLLMAVAAILAGMRNRPERGALLAILLGAVAITGSRAGWLTIPVLVAAAVYMRATTFREIATVAAGVAVIVAAVTLPAVLAAPGIEEATLERPIAIVPEAASTSERLHSLIGGWRLFLERPAFGAGLGVFVAREMAESGSFLVIHSTVVWLLAELGVVGTLVFVVPAGFALVSYARGRRVPDDMAARVVVLVLVSFAVMSLPHELLFQRTLWLLLGAALALPRRTGP